MINEEIREIIEFENGEAILFDNPSFDNSIIGISSDGRVVYDYMKMVTEFANENNVSLDEAEEFIDYNTIRALPYTGSYGPIIMNEL